MGQPLKNIEGHGLTLKGPAQSWSFGTTTLIMGVVNVTPDSFSDGGQCLTIDKAVDTALRMVDDGASIIDVGGESSRPGADTVSLAEELKRVIPVVEALTKRAVTVSIDTTKAAVAEEAFRRGAEILNDISALGDSKMAEVAASSKAAVILMHKRGVPKTMQNNVTYGDVMAEISGYLQGRINYALKKGIEFDRIVVDPGIGFGKSAEGNLEIIKRLTQLKELGRPILIGPSRKSFIGSVLDAQVTERLVGTMAAVAAAVLNGAHMVRVHDVKEASQVCRMIDAIKNI